MTTKDDRGEMKTIAKRTLHSRKKRTVDKEKEQQWRGVLARFQKSGLPFKRFCTEERISPNTFQYWRRELRKRDEELGITSTISKGDNRPSNLQRNVDYWLRVINEINVYEGSVRGYCRSHGIASGSLHFWEKRLRKMKLTDGLRNFEQRSDADSKFVPVQIFDDCAEEEACSSDVVRTVAAKSPILAAEFTDAQGRHVRIFNGADRSTLSALIGALTGS